KIGVYVDGKLSWTDDDTWEFTFAYPHNALIGNTIAKNKRLGIILEFDDTVDAEMSVLIRNVHVINHSDKQREIKLYMHQALAIGDSRSSTDTAQYLPDSNAILHYRGRRAVVVSGRVGDQPFEQYTLGLFGIEGREGTYRDAEDGELTSCNVEHGRVDSTLRFQMELEPGASSVVEYWIAAGTSLRDALYVHKSVGE